MLAVAAAKLGFAPVVALDNDEAAVEAARANAAANDAEVEVLLADAVTDPLPESEIAVANIAREPVERVAEAFAGGLLIASGYLRNELPSAVGWARVERRLSGEWAADLLARAGE